MALSLDAKKAIVAEMVEVVSGATSVVLADYRGLTVDEMTELRSNARKSGVYLRVVRNNLMKRAVKDTEFECIHDAMTGPMMLAFAKEEPGAAARLVHDFSKTHEKLDVKGVAIGGQLMAASSIEQVAKLPTRDQALATLMSVMKAPITKFVRTVAEPHAKLVRTLAAVAEDKKAAA